MDIFAFLPRVIDLLIQIHVSLRHQHVVLFCGVGCALHDHVGYPELVFIPLVSNWVADSSSVWEAEGVCVVMCMENNTNMWLYL